MVMALGTAILTEAFPPAERGKAFGIGGSLVSIGIVVGPTAGGLLIDTLSWHWIFFVNLPVGLIGSLMALRFVPAIMPAGRERFDYLGAATLFVSLFSLLIGLSIGQRVGFGEMPILLLFVGSAIFLALFIAIERKAGQPMIDLTLFRNALISVNLITGLLTFISMSGTLILVPFYLQGVLRYQPAQVGLLMAIVPLAMGVIAPISGSLSDRFGARQITVIGLATLLVGYFAISSLNAATTIPGYLLRFLPIGLGMGIFQSPNNSAIMGEAPRHRLGVASGLLSMTRSLGQITGIAVMGALWATYTAQYAGNPFTGGATNAPAEAQVAGLHDTVLFIIVLISLALALGLWALIKQRRDRRLAGRRTLN